MTAILKIELIAGAHIDDACETACRVSSLLGIGVEFQFNSVRCLVRPVDHSPKQLAEAWSNELKRELRGMYDSRTCYTGRWRL